MKKKSSKLLKFLISWLLILTILTSSILPTDTLQAASHTHTGDCYENATLHTCTGSTSNGGGCYTTKNYHQHTNCATHTHSGNTTNGGTCYATPVYHSHTNCENHAHSGNSTSGGGCYGTANYHTHTDNCGKIVYPKITELSYSTYPNESFTVKVSAIETRYDGEIRTTYMYLSYGSGGSLTVTRGWYNEFLGSSSSENVTGESSYREYPVTEGYVNAVDNFVWWCSNNGSLSLTSKLAYMEETYPGMYLTVLADLSNLLIEIQGTSYIYTASNLQTKYTCAKTTSTVESYSLNCGKSEGYQCGKETTTIESYQLSCTKSEGYQCGKTTSTVESYSKSCGKTNGKYYTSSGVEATAICDKVIAKIVPNGIATQYRKNHGQATAVATYLDGRTGTVNVTTNYDPTTATVGTKNYTATYKGRVGTASSGTGTLTASISIETVGASSFVLDDDVQLIAKGSVPNYKGTVTYGSLGSFTTTEYITSNFNPNKVGVQTITVTYDGGNKVTDTMTVRIPASPIAIKAENVTTTKGTDKTITATVTYEDGTTKTCKFQLSDTKVDYTDTYTEGSVSSTLTFSWNNQNASETGKDYKTGGVYTLNMEYEGISSSITVTVMDSCSKNVNHEDFSHDVCPTCKTISSKQASFDTALSDIIKLSTLAEDNKTTLATKDFPTEQEILSRDVEEWKELKQQYEAFITELENLSTIHSDKVTAFRSEWEKAATTEEVNEILNSSVSYKTGKEDSIIDNYNQAIAIYNQANQLREQKNTINNFTPVITIIGDLTKTYDQKALTWSETVTVADFEDSDFVNPVEYYIYENDKWIPFEKELIDAGIYTLKAVTTDTDYQIGEKQFTVIIHPKVLTVDYTGQNKVYDGNASITLTLALDGILKDDMVTVDEIEATYASKNVGTEIVITPNNTITLKGIDASNYKLEDIIFKGNITKKPLTILYENQDKIYDGNKDAALFFTLDGIVKGDIVSTNYSISTYNTNTTENNLNAVDATYSQSTVGSELVITPNNAIALTGEDANNYRLIVPEFRGSILKKQLNVIYSNQDKTYDGTDHVELEFTLTGILGTDKVDATSGTGTYSQSDVGNDLLITLDTPFALIGADANNYTYDIPDLKGTILPRNLNLSYRNQDKVYDGTNEVTLKFTLDGVLAGDTVKTSSGKGVYADKNAGNDIDIILDTPFVLEGTDADNYTVITPTLKGDIRKKPLTITTKNYEAEYGEIPTIDLIYNGFIEGEDEEVFQNKADIWYEVPVTKVGTQVIYVNYKINQPINYDIQPIHSSIYFHSPDDFVAITVPLPIHSPATVVVDGIEKVLEEPFEIWHPTDRDIVISSEGKDWNISSDGKVSFIVDSKDVIITDDFVIVEGERIPNPTGSVLVTGTGNLSINHYDGEVILKDFETDTDVTISDNSNTTITVEGKDKINGSVIVDTTSSIVIQGDGTLDVLGGIGGTKENPSGDISIEKEVEVNADYIGNHPDYIPKEEDKKPNVNINGSTPVVIGNATVTFYPQPVIHSNDSTIVVSGSSVIIDGIVLPNENDVTVSGTGHLIVSNYNGTLTLNEFQEREDILITESIPNITVSGNNHVAGSVVVGTGSSIIINGTALDNLHVSEGIGGTEVVSSGAITLNGASIHASYLGNHENYVSTGGAITADITILESSIVTDKTTITWESENGEKYPVIDTVKDVIINGNQVYIEDIIVMLPSDKVVILGSGNLNIKDYQGEVTLKDAKINGTVQVSQNSNVDMILEGNAAIDGSLHIDESSKVTISGTGSLVISDLVTGTLMDEEGNVLKKVEITLPKEVSGEILYTREDNKQGTWYTAEEQNGVTSLFIKESADKIYITIGNNSYSVDLSKEPYTLVSEKPPVSEEENPDKEEDGTTSDKENGGNPDNKEDGSTSDKENEENPDNKEDGSSSDKENEGNPDNKEDESTSDKENEGNTDNKEDGSSSNDKNEGTTGNQGNHGSSVNGGSSSGSNGNSENTDTSDTESETTEKEETSITDVSEFLPILVPNSKTEDTRMVQKGDIIYITTDKLTVKEPYVISLDKKEWASELPLGDCGTYSTYQVWVKNTETNEIYQVSLNHVVVDYKKPTAKLKSSISKIKATEKEKVTYTYYTNDKIKFKLYNLDFGISGKEKIEYQVVKKGKKLKETKWNTLKKEYFYVKPSGYMQVFIRLTDKAGNQTILKTTGFKSDKTAPKIKQNGWIIQGIDTNSGIKKVLVNGKKVKTKYRLTKPGTYTVTVYDKAGNKTTKKIKIKKDKTKPVIQFKNNKVTVTDNQSGVKKVTINGKKVSSTKTLKKKGTYKIVAYDKAGNKAVKTVIIKAKK